MAPLWEPGTQYNLGDVVVFEGVEYKIIQPHRSQGDWTPPVTPALWGRCQSGGYPHEKPHYEQPSYEKPPQEPYHAPPQTEAGPPPQQGGGSWLSEHKKEAEIGGLVAGLAVAGAGLFAYKQHEKHQEQKRENSYEAWLQAARARTEQFHQQGPQAPTTWVLVNGHDIPQGAIPGGEENGEPIYIARAFHKGSVQVGKASRALRDGAAIGYAHDEIPLGTYEILLGDRRAIRWVDFSGKLKIEKLGARPVEGGHEENGVTLYIAQAHYHNSIQVGKISEKLHSAFIPYGGGEKEVKDYRVLCYV